MDVRGILGFVLIIHIYIYIYIYKVKLAWEFKRRRRKENEERKSSERCRGVIGKEWEKWVASFRMLVDLPNNVHFT